MNTEIIIITDPAETVYIRHPEASYGIFCFNSKGDLFLNSDWGFFGFAWRHYSGGSFKEWLSTCDADYVTGKFAINWNGNNPARAHRFGGERERNIKILVTEFLKSLKQ